MASIVEIYNQALTAIGQKGKLQSPDEPSIEAGECNLWYADARDQVLRAAPWNCATGTARLALQAERNSNVAWVATDPRPGWRFAYSIPNDMLRPRYLTTFARFDLGVSAASSRVLYSNEEASILVYTQQLTNPELWDVDLRQAIVFSLAASIAPRLTGSKDRTRLVIAQAIDKITNARVNSANEVVEETEHVPDWLAARGYGGSTPSARYVYPMGDISISGTNYGLS